MAQIIRSSKPGSRWTANELHAYHITIVNQTANVFFGHHPGHIDHLDQLLLNSPPDAPPPGASDITRRFLFSLAAAARMNEETSVDIFAQILLHVMGFDRDPDHTSLFTFMQRRIGLTICGKWEYAIPDVSLVDRILQPHIFLIVHESKTIYNPRDPEPQLIAEAIAAYQTNNKTRITTGREPLDAMTIPGITMVGTWPTFYLVQVTRHLKDSITLGSFPEHETRVRKFSPMYHGSPSMRNLQNRRTVLRCYDRFCRLAREHWSTFI